MRIVVPSKEDRGLDSRITAHPRMAPYLVVVDVDEGGNVASVRSIPNPYAGDERGHHHEEHGHAHGVGMGGGVGMGFARFLGSLRPDAIITYTVGSGAFRRLSEQGVRIYRPKGHTVGEAVRALLAGELREMEGPTERRGPGRADLKPIYRRAPDFPDVRVTVLVDNCAAQPSSLGSRLLAEWGFSAYLHEPRILYDTGLTGLALINNMRALGIDPDDPDYLVLSHGHLDHTGGVIKLLDMRTRPLTVIAHEVALSRGAGFTADDLRRRNARVVAIREPREVAGGVIASGGIPRRWGPSHVGGVADEVPDDMALYLKAGSGLVAITGCGHSGVENIVEYGLQLTGAGRLRAIIGGLHFMGLGRARMEEAARYLASRDPEVVAAMHCTGLEGQAVLMGALGGGFRVGGVGSEFEFRGRAPGRSPGGSGAGA